MADEETTETDENEPQFIDFQEDPARPGQHIDCADELAYVEQPLACPDCVPDPDALVPDWINLTEPILNERTCEYQVMMVTEYEGTGGESLQDRMDEYIIPGLRKMMRFYGKLETDEIVEAISIVAGAVDYHLGGPDRTLPRPYMKMRVLIAVPAANFNNLQAAPDENEAEEEGTAAYSITLNYSDLREQTRKIKLIFKRYNKFHAIYWQTERGMVVYESGSPVNYDLEASNVELFFSELRAFIRRKGYSEWIPSWSGKKLIQTVTINLNEETRLLSSIELTQPGCEHKPEIFSGTAIETLKEASPFNSVTTLNFIVNTDSIINDITAREPLPWLEFTTKHFYPTVSINYGLGSPDQDGADSQTVMGCYVDNLGLSGMGQSFLEEVYGLPDAIAYKFNKQLCYPQEKREEKKKEEEDQKTLLEMAKAAALEEYCKDDPMFQELPEKLRKLGSNAGATILLAGTGANAMVAKSRIRDAWTEIFDTLRKCGLYSLMIDSIKCLLGGVDLTSALKTMIKSALTSMSGDSLQQLYVGLPPDEQSRVNEKMLEIWGSVEFPWDHADSPEEGTQAPSATERATLAAAKDKRREEIYTELKDAYMEAILGAYADDVDTALTGDNADRLLLLVEHLNGFPGAEIIARIIATFDCPTPPDEKEDGLLDWYKDIELNFCNETEGLHIPKWPKRNGVNRKDVMSLLMSVAKEAARELALKMLTQLLLKLMESWTSLLCDTLGAIGEQATTNFPNSAFDNPQGFLLDAIRDSFCGPNATDEDALSTMEQLFGNIGAVSSEDAEDMSNAESISDLITNIESILTRGELLDLLNGSCADYVLSMIDELLNTENTAFRGALPTKDSICNLFSNLGDFMPQSVIDALDFQNDVDNTSASMPAMTSLCACDETLQTFKDMRCELLMAKGDGITEEQCEEQYDKLKDKTLDDLGQLTNVMQNGPLENMPNIEGPCDINSILPQDTDEALEAASETSSLFLRTLQNAITNDLIGRWGLLNLILSDTNGLTYKRHNLRTRMGLFFPNYYDFYGQSDDEDTFSWGSKDEHGVFPQTIARWLREQMLVDSQLYGPDVGGITSADETSAALPMIYQDTMELHGPVYYEIPVEYEAYAAIDQTTGEPILSVTIPARKHPDLTMYFYDNNRGQDKYLNTPDPDDFEKNKSGIFKKKNLSNWVYGFRLDYSSFTLNNDYELPTEISSIRQYRVTIHDVNPSMGAIADGDGYDVDNPDFYSVVSYTDDDGNDRCVPGLMHDFVVNASLDPEVYTLASNLASGLTFTDYSPSSQIFAQYILNVLSNAGLPSVTSSDNLRKEIVENTYKTIYDSLIATIRGQITDESSDAWVFGYQKEDLTADDALYLDPLSTSDSLIPYDHPEELKILGVSAHSVTAGSGNRIHYLDPAKYGGRYSNPPLYITPPKRHGWLGLAEAIVPGYDGCEPRRADLIDFENIKDRIDELNQKLPEDERLNYNPNCVDEVPYARIHERPQAAHLEGIVLATLRTYAVEHVIKAMPMFSKYAIIDDAFLMYIINEMESEMLEEGAIFGKLRRDRYWYAFLEQCVQVQDNRYKLGEYEPNQADQEAFGILAGIQTAYYYPQDSDLIAARENGEVVMGVEINALTTLKRYRLYKNLEAVKNSADTAKVLMRSLLAEQIEWIMNRIRENMVHLGLDPKITSMKKHILGSSRMCMGPEFFIDIETAADTTDGSGYVVGEYDAVTGTQNLGNVNNVAKTIDEYPLEESTITSWLLNSPMANYDPETVTQAGSFIVEKYIYMEDSTATIKGDRWQEGGPKITDDDYELRGVVNIETFIEWLGRLDDSMKTAKLSDYFGDLSFEYPEGTVYYSEGETSENAMHTHEYVIDENGNGVAYSTAPPNKPWLSHSHVIENYFVKAAYSPAAKEKHVHDLQIDESSDTEPIGLEGSMGIKYGMRLSYIPSKTAAQMIDEVAGSELESETFLENAKMEKAYKLNGSPSENISDYVIPLASVEIDLLDETFEEVLQELESNGDDISPEVLACLGSKLSNSNEMQLLFDYCIPVDTIAGLHTIYVSRAFLPAIGELTTDLQGEDSFEDGEWNQYGHKRMYNGSGPTRKERREILGARMGPGWDNGPLAPGVFSPQKHPLEKTFAKTKRRVRNMFLMAYNHREFSFNLPGFEIPSFGQMLKDRFWLGNWSEILTWRQRRKLIDNPYDKDGNECD